MGLGHVLKHELRLRWILDEKVHCSIGELLPGADQHMRLLGFACGDRFDSLLGLHLRGYKFDYY